MPGREGGGARCRGGPARMVRTGLAALLFGLAAGCSTAPIADLLDHFKPGQLGPERTPPYGGVCVPSPVGPLAGGAPVSGPPPGFPAPVPPPAAAGPVPIAPAPVPPPTPPVTPPPGPAAVAPPPPAPPSSPPPPEAPSAGTSRPVTPLPPGAFPGSMGMSSIPADGSPPASVPAVGTAPDTGVLPR
jgi:hypothetical protein